MKLLIPRPGLTILTFAISILLSATIHAQYDSSHTNKAPAPPTSTTKSASTQTPASGTISNTPDEDGSREDKGVFITFLTLFLALIAGISVAGAFIVLFLFLLLIVMLGSGILSAAVLAGLYRRSLATGLKTLIVLTSGACGILLGITGMFLIRQLADLHLSGRSLLLIGGLGGLAGGVLLGLIIFFLLRLGLTYLKEKFRL